MAYELLHGYAPWDLNHIPLAETSNHASGTACAQTLQHESSPSRKGALNACFSHVWSSDGMQLQMESYPSGHESIEAPPSPLLTADSKRREIVFQKIRVVDLRFPFNEAFESRYAQWEQSHRHKQLVQQQKQQSKPEVGRLSEFDDVVEDSDDDDEEGRNMSEEDVFMQWYHASGFHEKQKSKEIRFHHEDNDLEELEEGYLKYLHPEVRPISLLARDFIERVLARDPSKRLDLEGMLEHPFLLQCVAAASSSS